MSTRQTPFGRHEVRSRIGRLHSSLPDRSEYRVVLDRLLDDHDAGSDEQHTALQLRPIIGKLKKHRSSAVRERAHELEQGLDAAEETRNRPAP